MGRAQKPDQASGLPACGRSGLCCEFVLLSHSPSQLRTSYRSWVTDGKEGGDVSRLEGIHLIFPMLEGRCRGKYVAKDGGTRYVYGPCKNFAREKGQGKKPGKGICTIHDNRPALCRGYPYYQNPQTVQMGERRKDDNPGYMRGCGYNSDRKAGHAPSDFGPGQLTSLEESEK